MSGKKSISAKAFFSIAFASGICNPPLPVTADYMSGPSLPLIERIALSPNSTAEVRAVVLLELAEGYLAREDRTIVEARFVHLDERPQNALMLRHFRINNQLVAWANRLASERNHSEHRTDSTETALPKHELSNLGDNLDLANAAIERALKQLDQTSDQFVKLNMYFVASLLFQKAGNVDQYRKCNDSLEQSFRSCEKSLLVDESQTKAASSVLNSMAYGVIPVEIPEQNPKYTIGERQSSVASFSEDDFKKSEKLRLRAEAMADRLESTADTRRRIHRDLSLWYTQLGKADKAAQQKQILFELVGIKDDRILYPVQAGCGGFVWWGDESRVLFGACGMG